MNKMNKKGFTIVELVIVIAVIAILAGVLIPTFGGIIEKANLSAEMQKVTAAYKSAYANALADGKIDEKDFKDNGTDKTPRYTVEAEGVTFAWEKVTGDDEGKWSVVTGENPEYTYTYDMDTNAWTVTEYKAPANNG